MKRIQVLVLDDEENILKSVARMLMNESYGVATTVNPEEALQILTKEEIKVIISDQRMPTTTGVEFLQKAKKIRPDAIRVLFTGYSDINAVEQAINLGEVYRYLNKPWQTMDFKATLQQAMGHYDLVMENRRLFEETQLKNCELLAANEMLKMLFDREREFTSTVSHELRTPLASIKTAIDIILSGTPGPVTTDQSTFLGKAKNNVDRLSRLINDILDLTKLELGQNPLKIQTVNLKELVSEICVLQSSVAELKGLKVVNNVTDQIPTVDVDVDKMHQVFNNLVANAIKFTDKGQITISAQYLADDNAVCVSIEDTGRGIKDEDQDLLFQKFKQLGDPTQRVNGTGLGLAICKEIVKQHGGRIDVESSLGIGSRFFFTLPTKIN